MPLSKERGAFRDLVRLLRPRPTRLEFAMRLAIICAATVLVVQIYQTPEPALTIYIVFFLNRENRATSLIMNAVFLVLITVIIGFIFLVTLAVADDPMWRVVSIASLSFAFLFLASASKLRPIGGTIALIVGYALDVLGNIQLGELATRGYLYAWLFVAIPVGVSIIINFLLAPAPRSLAERAIAQRLQLAAAMLQAPNESLRRTFRACLREGVEEVYAWLKLAGREKTSSNEAIAALHQAAGSTVALLSAIDVMDRNPEAALPGDVREWLTATFQKMAGILMNGEYPTNIRWEVEARDRQLSKIAAEILAEVKDAITGFADPSKYPIASAESKNEKRSFFVEDAFINPDHVHYALKTTGAAMFCYLLYSLLDWPGIHTAFITCYIVSLSTTAETIEKLVLRIAGCLVGAAAGIAAIVFLLPYLTSIGELMALVFLGAYAAAYVAGGSQRISYAGFQIAFAFFLCVIQGPSPMFDLTIARDRIIGILVGNVVVYLLFTNLWPVTVGKRIDPAISNLLKCLGAMMRGENSGTRRAAASKAQTVLTTIESDIDLAAYEPEMLRPSERWLGARRQAVKEISAIESSLLLSADIERGASGHIAERLEALAGHFSDRLMPPLGQGVVQRTWRALPLYSVVDKGLRRLEALLN